MINVPWGAYLTWSRNWDVEQGDMGGMGGMVNSWLEGILGMRLEVSWMTRGWERYWNYDLNGWTGFFCPIHTTDRAWVVDSSMMICHLPNKSQLDISALQKNTYTLCYPYFFHILIKHKVFTSWVMTKTLNASMLQCSTTPFWILLIYLHLVLLNTGLKFGLNYSSQHRVTVICDNWPSLGQAHYLCHHLHHQHSPSYHSFHSNPVWVSVM